MVLHIHKEVTDQLDLNEVANDFVSKSERVDYKCLESFD